MIKPLSAKERKELESLSTPKFETPAPVSLPNATSLSFSNANQTPIVEQKISKETKNSIDTGAGPSNKSTERILTDGDYVPSSEEQTPLRANQYQKLDFLSPFDVVSFYNKGIRDGLLTLHPWQLDVSDTLGYAKPDSQKPYKFSLCACNGSGKDAFVIAPFAVWFALCKIQSRCIITSSSGVQLTAQTESYIRALAQQVNEYHGEEIFKIRQRYIRCTLSGSEIRLFATDEEGKAEGYHPIEAGTEMAIIINEAKSVAPEIFRALRRCTGYNYWIEVSTPGPKRGDFYTHFQRWKEQGRGRHVTTYDCPHLSAVEREEDKVDLGEHSMLFRSKHLALFTSEDEDTIVSEEVISRNREYSKSGKIKREHSDWPKRVGIDLAAGGDETSIYITQGNTILDKLNFREKDTTITALRIDGYLNDKSIPKNHEHIYGDDGGVGRSIIDQLAGEHGMGWRISRVLNQSKASDTSRYSNRGAENWYRIKRLFEENIWFFNPLHDDTKLCDQLANRFYKQGGTNGKIALQSKAEAKADGHPSPDRADALILSLTGLTISDFINVETISIKKIPDLKHREGFRTNEEIIAWHEAEQYKEYAGEAMNGDKHIAEGKPNGSLNSLLNRHKKPIYSFRPN